MQSNEQQRLLKVKSSTDPIQLGNSITRAYQENPEGVLCIRSIGAGALNQAIKAVILSNKTLSNSGLYATLHPYFMDIPAPEMGNDSKTISAIQLTVIVKRHI